MAGRHTKYLCVVPKSEPKYGGRIGPDQSLNGHISFYIALAGQSNRGVPLSGTGHLLLFKGSRVDVLMTIKDSHTAGGAHTVTPTLMDMRYLIGDGTIQYRSQGILMDHFLIDTGICNNGFR